FLHFDDEDLLPGPSQMRRDGAAHHAPADNDDVEVICRLRHASPALFQIAWHVLVPSPTTGEGNAMGCGMALGVGYAARANFIALPTAAARSSTDVTSWRENSRGCAQ